MLSEGPSGWSMRGSFRTLLRGLMWVGNDHDQPLSSEPSSPSAYRTESLSPPVVHMLRSVVSPYAYWAFANDVYLKGTMHAGLQTSDSHLPIPPTTRLVTPGNTNAAVLKKGIAKININVRSKSSVSHLNPPHEGGFW